MTTRAIYVTKGAKRYVGGTVTETTGKDISGATFTIALGTDAKVPPASIVGIPVSAAGATSASRVLKMLVDNTVTVGTYYCWVKVVDSPEIEPIMIQGPITVA